MMQFDDREGRRDRVIRPDAHGHFPFDRQVCEVLEIQSLAVSADLAFEKASSDRPLHPELLRGAWPRAANLVANQTISGRNPKLRDRVLELVSGSERQVELRVGEARSGLAPAVVAPLAISELR
jgi:hypothetical protein